MTLYVAIESEADFPFDIETVARSVAQEALEAEGCPYDCAISLTIVDNAGIRELNRDFRDIDRETDVLSFPNLEFETPGDFSVADNSESDCFDPDTGELVLGDIVISTEKVKEQAENYGHSTKREFAFLVAHSMFHLCGYDHMTEDEAGVMEEKQEAVLTKLGITRKEED
jgi:probable rRNA maturation factor